MGDDSLIAAIKGGLKGELDSVTVYEEAAGKAEGDVRDFFLERAAEEKRHYNWLLAYHKELSEGGKAGSAIAIEAPPKATFPIPSEDFLRRIGSSRQLSAALSAAVLLEIQAIHFYRAKAEEAVLAPLKKLFLTLVEWEEVHYHDLLAIQEESLRFYWDAARWEPF